MQAFLILLLSFLSFSSVAGENFNKVKRFNGFGKINLLPRAESVDKVEQKKEKPIGVLDVYNYRNFVVNYLKQNGIKPALAEKIKSRLRYKKKVIVARKNQLEKKLDLQGYLDRVNVERRLDESKKYIKNNQETFNNVSEVFDIDKNIIAALLSFETAFGEITGNNNAFESLFTMMIDARGNNARYNFFGQNIVALAKLIQDDSTLEVNTKSSWAGAIGQFQFMPINVFNYAIKVGNLDVFKNKETVYVSMFNFLDSLGWNKNEAFLTEVELPNNFDYNLIGINKPLKVKDVKNLKIKATGIGKEYFKNNNLDCNIIMPDYQSFDIKNKKNYRAFVVYDNFNVVLNWNKSMFFATSVGLLYEKLKTNY